MTERLDYDLCIVGAGSAGYAAAVMARSDGRSVVLVDGPGPLAGLCILRGCMPSKTLLRSAEVAALVRRSADFGIVAGAPRTDFARVMERKRRIIKGFADYRIEGIETFPLKRGAGKFTGPSTLDVDGRVIKAERFIVATGSEIRVPAIPGLRDAGYVTSDDVLELDELPKSVVVLGGGPTACELAQYLARLGVSTTLVQRSPTLLSFEDADVGLALARALERDGIRLYTGTNLLRVERTPEGKTVHFEHGGASVSATAREVFVALGRDPRVDGLGLETAGVDFSDRGVKVDAYLQTANPNVYAAGDVLHESRQLVHVAVYEGALAACNAFAATAKRADYSLQNSRAVFTEPQVAIAGRTERECRAAGIEYAVATYPFDDHGKAIATDRTEGFIKMLAASDGTILGVAIVGAEASDLIHESIALIHFRANVRDVMEMPHLHPTLAEIITYPAEELMERLEHEKRALVTP